MKSDAPVVEERGQVIAGGRVAEGASLRVRSQAFSELRLCQLGLPLAGKRLTCLLVASPQIAPRLRPRPLPGPPPLSSLRPATPAKAVGLAHIGSIGPSHMIWPTEKPP